MDREKSILDTEIISSTHGLRGRPKSAEHRQKISEAKRGKTLTAEHRTKLGEANRGKTLTDEMRQKLSEHAKKVWAARRVEYERRLQAGETGTLTEVLGLEFARKARTPSKPVFDLARACLGRWQARWDKDGFLLDWNPPQALRDFGPVDALLRVRTALDLSFHDEDVEIAYDRERRAAIRAAKIAGKAKRKGAVVQ